MPRFSISVGLIVMTGVAFLAAVFGGLSAIGMLLTGFGLFATYLALCLHHTRRRRGASDYRGRRRSTRPPR